MADKTGIEWTDATWNPIVGCSLESPGCTHCYAMPAAARLERMGVAAYAGLTHPSKAGPVWTGQVTLQEGVIDKPLSWRKPRRIFVNSMSDLFHPRVPLEWIARIFGVMVAAHHINGHEFQVLTKRSANMRAALSDPAMWAEAMALADAEIMDRVDPLDRRSNDARATCRDYDADDPPPGIWLGVSIEDQKRADERRDDLANLAERGWVTFVSYEPALGPVDWTAWGFLDWLISGGESGPNARPSHPDWHREARDFCAERDIAYFFKRWGQWAPGEAIIAKQMRPEIGAWWFAGEWSTRPIGVRESEEMHIDDEPDVWRVGSRADRWLDGVKHDAFPETGR
jgi:protein gp37